MSDYVIRSAEGTLRIAGTRVSLASVVHAFWRGETPEGILQAFPSLALEKIYGAITYYLGHREAVDQELSALEEKWKTLRSNAQQENQALRERLLNARKTADTT